MRARLPLACRPASAPLPGPARGTGRRPLAKAHRSIINSASNHSLQHNEYWIVTRDLCRLCGRAHPPVFQPGPVKAAPRIAIHSGPRRLCYFLCMSVKWISTLIFSASAFAQAVSPGLLGGLEWRGIGPAATGGRAHRGYCRLQSAGRAGRALRRDHLGRRLQER
ncbi:hypothetical protein SBA4_1870038 [Candidatus Sulfopaludibacter sp. SbA4]|nr:hypothetical protein SBA4_1870038 [Candidatus Sulfopaludibacter sp. SbA4]